MANPSLHNLAQRMVRISDQDYDPEGLSLENVLVQASRLYQAGVEIRLSLYRRKILKKKHLDCFVVSIGNLTAGGTGKTPMAIYLAELFRKLGKTALVISRGYKGKVKTGCALVGDGSRLFLDAQTAGDEPCMMAARKSFAVMVGRDRYEAGVMGLKRIKPDVIILDDGFQHIRLHRDLDILLFDHDRPLGNGRLLPAGRLRETPEAAGKRAHAIVFTRCPKTKKTRTGPMDRIRAFEPLPCFSTVHIPFVAKWISAQGQEMSHGLGDLGGRRALLFSGIARNPDFRATVEGLGCTVLDHLEFADHYRYKGPDILKIQQRMTQVQADLLVTTEKDWIRFDSDRRWDKDLAVIGVTIEFQDGKKFETFVRSRLAR